MSSTNCYFCKNPVDFYFEKDSRTYVRCPECGLVYTVTPVRKADLNTYYNTLDHKPQEVLARKVYKKLVRRMKYRLGIVDQYCNPEKRILDIGCAQGDFLRTAKENGYTCCGVELAAAACEYAREKLGIIVYKAELSEIRFSENSFDAVTMWHVFEHFTDPIGELREIYRILAPAGIVCMELPNLGSLAFRLQGKKWRYINDEHIFHFNKEAIAKFLATVSFKPVFITEISGLEWWGKLAGLKKSIHRLATSLDAGDHLVVVARKGI